VSVPGAGVTVISAIVLNFFRHTLHGINYKAELMYTNHEPCKHESISRFKIAVTNSGNLSLPLFAACY
jgi:hypothetical protein